MALTKVPSNLDATVAITQSASDNSTNVATTAYVDTAISNLSDSAPAALNTLNEIAAALGDDANYAATTTAAIAGKLPLAGGTMTGTIAGFTSTGIDDNADAVAITIDSSENIGIGETSPTRRLSVKKDTGITSGFNDIAEFLDTTLGVGGSVSLNIGKAASNKNLGKMAFKYAGNASNDNSLSFGFFDNDNLMKLTSTGKLVVGAAGPGNVGNGGLRLYSNIEETLAIDGSAGTQAIHFYDNNVRRGIIGITNGTSIAPAASDHDMVIRAETGGAIHFAISATSKVNIDSAGNVGIGTTSPGAKLEIMATRSSGANATALILHDNVTGVQTTGFGTRIEGRSNNNNAVSAIGFEAFGGTNNDTAITFHTQSVAGGLTRRMIIDSTGNIDMTGGAILKGMTHLEIKNNSGTDGSATSPRLYSPASGNLAISASGNERLRVDTTGVIIKGHLGINRGLANGSLFLGAGTVDANHALWNAYYGTSPTTRGAANSGFDGMYWNTYRGLHIRGGTAGASDCLIIQNSSSNTQDHTVKLFASGTERLATNTAGVAINGNITVSGTGDFTGKVDFQGTAAIEGGTSGSGYGVFKGYTANANHMLISRGKLSGTNTVPVITGGHEMTFVEYVGDDSSGFVFKSSHIPNSAYTEKVVFRSSHNTFQAAIRCIGTITASYSDERLKDVHGTIESALEKVQQLSGFYYTPNQTAQKLGYEKEKTVGLSAQAVQKVMPEVVKPAPVSFNEGVDEDYLTIQYEKLVPLLIESIKELKTELDLAKSRITELER